jgi:hypothetical protein
MCQFFSFVGDGYGNFKYFNHDERKKRNFEDTDSHTAILTHYKIPENKQDRWSRYEFNPLTKLFNIDQSVEGHEHEKAEKWVNELNFKKVVPELIIKKIINPFTDIDPIEKVTKEHLEFLKQWASVGDSVWTSVGASVGDSVGASVGDSVGDSVGASVWAYVSSFFDIKYKYDFSPINKLWEMGLVPSFDRKIWRLHTGKDAKIIWKGEIK